jgi:hypothetical protein
MEPSPTSRTIVTGLLAIWCVLFKGDHDRKAISRQACKSGHSPTRGNMELPIIQWIVALLKERRDNTSEEGNIGRGMLKELVHDHMVDLPWLTRNMVIHYMINGTDDNLVKL